MRASRRSWSRRRYRRRSTARLSVPRASTKRLPAARSASSIPNDPRNAIITDIKLAPRNAAGKVEYVASFFLVKPIDMSKASHLMWQDVPNRGGRVTINPTERNVRRHRLEQRLAGRQLGTHRARADNDWVIVPIAKNADGSPISGLVLGRIVNASGVELAADDRQRESGPLQAGDARHDESDA